MSACRALIVEADALVSAHFESIVARTVPSDIVVGAFFNVDVLTGTTYAFAAKLRSHGVLFAFVSASN